MVHLIDQFKLLVVGRSRFLISWVVLTIELVRGEGQILAVSCLDLTVGVAQVDGGDVHFKVRAVLPGGDEKIGAEDLFEMGG